MDALQCHVREHVKQIQQESNKSCTVDYSLLLGDNDIRAESHLKEATGEEANALRGRLIRRLISITVHHVPTFWRSTLLIFNGKFAKIGSTNGTPVSVKRERSTARQNSFEDSLGDVKYSNNSLEEVAGMV